MSKESLQIKSKIYKGNIKSYILNDDKKTRVNKRKKKIYIEK